MTNALAVACIGFPAITFSLIGAPGLLFAACIAPGVLILWILDRNVARQACVYELPSIATTVTLAPTATEEPQSGVADVAAAKLMEQPELRVLPRVHPRPLHAPAALVDRFQRHKLTPGRLYAARNSYYCDDLYKLGYTTVSTAHRINTLNEEHGSDTHVGSFEAVHSVAVESAYIAEQRLFELLRAYRVADKREFFVVPKAYLLRAMDGVSSESRGLIRNADEWLGTSAPPVPDMHVMMQPAIFGEVIPAKKIEVGYVLIVRNPWHAQHVYRLASTELDPHAYLDSANSVQRNHTSQIGFYALISVHPVCSPRATCAAILSGAKKHRIGPSSFIQMSLSDLTVLVQRCLAIERSAARPAPVAPPTPTIGHRLPGESWHENTCPYTGCFSNVRAAGAVGRTGELRCYECRRRVGYEIATNGGLEVWRDT